MNMEDPKKNEVTTDVEAQVKLVDKEPIVEAFESTPSSAATVGATKKWPTYVAVALVIFSLAAVWMRLEKEGRVDTNLFSGFVERQEANKIVAVVNGEKINNAELELSMQQQMQIAASQGVDTTDPSIMSEVRSQATDMLVNTMLLRQTAVEQGIAATDEEVFGRIEELETAAGGAEVLAARMEEFDITKETFEADVRSELTILSLLDKLFDGADVSVSEEETATIYNNAVESGAEVPPLAEVRAQIEAQVQQTKEQSVVDQYIQELRAAADIEILE